MKLFQEKIFIMLLALVISKHSFADCSSELFNIHSAKNTKIIHFIERLSDTCNFSIVVSDPYAQEFLKSNLNKTNICNLTIHEVLDLILKENNLSYTLKKNMLKISYLQTKMFRIDYILSQRKSKGSTDITLSSEGAGIRRDQRAQMMRMRQRGSNKEHSTGTVQSGKSGVKIQSEDEVRFWHKLDLEFQKILNMPQDTYKAQAPIINKNAGIVTVTATAKQLRRFQKYLKNLQEKVQLQVLIDVQLLSVTLKNQQQTGIDWSQIYNMQNFDLTLDKAKRTNVSGNSLESAYEGDTVRRLIQTGNTYDPDTGEAVPTYELAASAGERAAVNTTSALFTLSRKFSIHNLLMFLKTQGKVNSISNPKILTLNNQAALITAGTEYFYKITNTQTLAGGVSGAQSSQENVLSIFAGVLLDITPEISDSNMITLKINPSVSETASKFSSDATQRTMPPDLNRRQLSSVVRVKDGNRIILGGLINTRNTDDTTKIPLLGDIPLLGNLFKFENKQKIVQELVIVIQPHIIAHTKELSLSHLGYRLTASDSVEEKE